MERKKIHREKLFFQRREEKEDLSKAAKDKTKKIVSTPKAGKRDDILYQGPSTNHVDQSERGDWAKPRAYKLSLRRG